MNFDLCCTDVAWLAGLWEGEGSIICGLHTDNRGHDVRSLHFTIAQSDKEVLERAQVILIYHGIQVSLYENRSVSATGRKRAWILSTHSYMNVEKACQLIWNAITTRRRQQVIEAFLKYCEDYRPTKNKNGKLTTVYSQFCDMEVDEDAAVDRH